MKVKDVNSRDLNQIMILEKEVFRENAFSKLLMEQLICRNAFFLKLVNDKYKNELIGFIIAINDKKDRINIINFLINPRFQNKGYGALLLKDTLQRITQLKEIKKVVLNVQESNSQAIKLYEKFNFRKNPKKIENYYQSGESAYLMELFIESL
ncbi:MAG: GNAT family N-acetyltransferase [Candidatus Thorarchaeota archaeon]